MRGSVHINQLREISVNWTTIGADWRGRQTWSDQHSLLSAGHCAVAITLAKQRRPLDEMCTTTRILLSRLVQLLLVATSVIVETRKYYERMCGLFHNFHLLIDGGLLSQSSCWMKLSADSLDPNEKKVTEPFNTYQVILSRTIMSRSEGKEKFLSNKSCTWQMSWINWRPPWSRKPASMLE